MVEKKVIGSALGLILIIAVASTLYLSDYRTLLSNNPDSIAILIDYENNNRLEMITRGYDWEDNQEVLRWRYDETQTTLYTNGLIAARSEWRVETKAGTLQRRSYTAGTPITYFEEDDSFKVVKELNYMRDHTLTETHIFTSNLKISNFPEDYTVAFDPVDSKEYKLTWVISEIEFLPDQKQSRIYDCEIHFGNNVKVNWCNEVDNIDYVFLSKQYNALYVHFKPVSERTVYDLTLVDPAPTTTISNSCGTAWRHYNCSFKFNCEGDCDNLYLGRLDGNYTYSWDEYPCLYVADSSCDDSNAESYDYCRNLGGNISYCESEDEIIYCDGDKDCGDNNACTIDICNQDGTTDSYCVHVELSGCLEIICTGDGDCSGGGNCNVQDGHDNWCSYWTDPTYGEESFYNSTDGNYPVWYWSDSSDPLTETGQYAWIAIDKTPPTHIINDFNFTGYIPYDVNVQLECSDSTSGCVWVYYSVNDVNYQVPISNDVNIGIDININGNNTIWAWVGDNSDWNSTPTYSTINLNKPDECGYVITSDYTMTTNLFNCSGDGLIIDANSVTLDCAGYKITSDGSSVSGENGIDINGASTRILNHAEIKNCHIESFYYGIYSLYSTDTNVLDSNVLLNSAFGIFVNNSDRLQIHDVNIMDNGSYGLYALSSNDSNITDVNTMFNSRGIYFNDIIRSNISDVNIYGNTNGLYFNGDTSDININNVYVSDNSQGIEITSDPIYSLLITNSNIINNTFDGIRCGTNVNPIRVYDSNISGNDEDVDVRLCKMILINTLYTTESVTAGDGNLYVGWWVDVNASYDGNFMPLRDFTINMDTNDGIYSESAVTGFDGWTPVVALYNKIIDSSATHYLTWDINIADDQDFDTNGYQLSLFDSNQSVWLNKGYNAEILWGNVNDYYLSDDYGIHLYPSWLVDQNVTPSGQNDTNGIFMLSNTSFIGAVDVSMDLNMALPNDSNLVVCKQNSRIKTYDMDVNLVGVWHFNEGNGTTAYGELGNNGTLEGVDPADWVDGYYGNALDFNGSSSGVGQNVNVGSDSVFDVTTTDDLSLSAWVKRGTHGGSSTYTGIVGRSGSYLPWGLIQENGYQINFSVFHTDTTAPNRLSLTTTDIIPLNEWTHVVGTWDHITGVQSIYFNGDLSRTTTHTPTEIVDESGWDVEIGGNGGNLSYKGSIDDVRIYADALTATEVSNLYSQGNDLYGNYCMDINASSPAKIVSN